MCDRVMVMYAGRVVEEGPTAEVFAHHPRTWSLLRSPPRPDAGERQPPRAVDGQPPDLSHLPRGCAFHPRRPFLERRPEPRATPGVQRAACCVTPAGTALPEEAPA